MVYFIAPHVLTEKINDARCTYYACVSIDVVKDISGRTSLENTILCR